MPSKKTDLLGRWPLSGPQARKDKRILVIKPSQMLNLIHGHKNHMLISFAVSNDFIHFGAMTISGQIPTDPEVHKGDEVFYVLEGSVSVIIESTMQTRSVGRSRFEVGCGECFLIPENVSHRYLNNTVIPAKLIFGIAPDL